MRAVGFEEEQFTPLLCEQQLQVVDFELPPIAVVQVDQLFKRLEAHWLQTFHDLLDRSERGDFLSLYRSFQFRQQFLHGFIAG